MSWLLFLACHYDTWTGLASAGLSFSVGTSSACRPLQALKATFALLMRQVLSGGHGVGVGLGIIYVVS